MLSRQNIAEHGNRGAPKVYASGMIGNGAAHGKGTTGDRKMEGKAFEIRLGKEIGLFSGNGGVLGTGGKLRLDFVHYNEGHPDNNHRDGFAVQAVYRKSLTKRVDAEIGFGPYLSMNTTTINGTEYDDQRLGVLASLAALIRTDILYPGTHVRLAFNHASMPGAHFSNAVLIGLGKDFDPSPAPAPDGFAANRTWLGIAGGPSITNHGNADGAFGFNIEAKRYSGQWAASVSALVEGDDDVRVDRRGIAAQGWFVQPLTRKWAASIGFGPYIAANRRGSGNPLLHGILTMQIERPLGEYTKLYASFSRVTTFREKNDRDLLRIGIMKQLGR